MAGMPGLGTEQSVTPRQVMLAGEKYLPGGKVISGAVSRDPLNTGDLDILRPGLVMGKITSSGEYAPSIIGVLSAAYDASAAGTTMTVSAATAVEIARRIGTSGTFKVTGPPTAAGTVKTVTITFSAIDTSTGAITITDITEDTTPAASIAETTTGVTAVAEVTAVDDVQTMTLSDGTDGGTFSIRYAGQATAALAFNVATADLQTAVRALHSDLSTTVVSSVGGVGVDYVFTTAGVACEDIEITADLLTDGGSAEPASITHTTQGVAAAAAVAAVTEVQTITMSAADGTFRVGYNGEWTQELDHDVTTANLQVALRTLTGLGSVTVAGTAGSSYVVTLTGVTGDVSLLDLDISNLASYSGDFISGSFVQPTDGSETPMTLIGNGYGIKVTDDDDNNIDTQYPQVLIGGLVDSSQIVNYPSDTSLKTWIKGQLVAANQTFTFDDDF